MPEHYTDEDVRAGRLTLDDIYSLFPGEQPPTDLVVKHILRRAAPAIAARALREFADGKITIQTPARMVEDLHDRADQIEAVEA